MLYVTSGDIYYLRLILLNRKARSDKDVLTYVPVCGGGEPIVCSIYQQSAIAHGYVDSVQDVTSTYDDGPEGRHSFLPQQQCASRS